MGNTSSTNNNADKSKFDNFYDVIDYIATYYILTMDFKSLSKLSQKAYCNNLIIITSDIIERYFNDMEVTYLSQRIKNGAEVNQLNTEKIIYINKEKLDSLDASNDKQKNIRKKRLCIGIAKFYVKIAHIFAAIVMTINPIYTYKDATGQTVKTGLLEKDKIPKNVGRKLYKLNICDNRIRALKRGEVIDETTGNVTIQPRVCDINTTKTGIEKTLADEPGITELMKIYLDDNYDYSNGTFTGMSAPTKEQFLKDLQLFYTAFTGNETMPAEITKFSDIKLRDYSKKPGCQPSNPILKMKYSLSKKDKLFVDYAENIKNMIQNAADNQYKLLTVINDLFSYVIDPYSGKRVIRVNPKLSDALLQKCIVKTRRLIVDLYVKCENDYVNGVKLFEAIVESKILSTTEKQIETLKKESTKIIENISAPVKQPALIKPTQPPVIINGPTTNTTSETNLSSSPTPTPTPITTPITEPITTQIPPTTTPIVIPTSTSMSLQSPQPTSDTSIPLKPIPGITVETYNSLPPSAISLPTNNSTIPLQPPQVKPVY